MSGTITHVGNEDPSRESAQTLTTPTVETVRHEEIMCALDNINKSLEILITYFAVITDTNINGKDIEL
jgi:hypothetical protein